MNLNLVVLDPAHGGTEPGATIGDNLAEKDVTLAVAAKLRALLSAAGFTVVSTRDAGGPDPITPDQRAEIANRTHALACIVLHATTTGSGVHVYTSTLAPAIADADSAVPSAFIPTPWETAQAAFVRQSVSLAAGINSSLGSSHLPVVLGHAPLRPLDNMMCPAVAVELAPLVSLGGRPHSILRRQLPAAGRRHHRLRPWHMARFLEASGAASCRLRSRSSNSSGQGNRGGAGGQSRRGTHPHPAARTRRDAMIPRYQRILFWILAGAIVLMALFLLHGCEQAREKLTRHRDETPLAAPVEAPSGAVRLALASDADGSITLAEREIALPAETTARARALLARLIAEYSAKDSAHPLESGPAIDDVFVLDLPLRQPAAIGSKALTEEPPATGVTSEPHTPGGQLAVINLRGTFADHHPSGIGPETLTIQSIIGTLYANFPRIEQVRFLVDGHPRDTLNGHADLLRTYPVVNTATRTAQAEPHRRPASDRNDHWSIRLRLWRADRAAANCCHSFPARTTFTLATRRASLPYWLQVAQATIARYAVESARFPSSPTACRATSSSPATPPRRLPWTRRRCELPSTIPVTGVIDLRWIQMTHLFASQNADTLIFTSQRCNHHSYRDLSAGSRPSPNRESLPAARAADRRRFDRPHPVIRDVAAYLFREALVNYVRRRVVILLVARITR